MHAFAAEPVEKYTFALLIEGEPGNAIIKYTEDFTKQAAKQDVVASGYILGTNQFTGPNEKALPHITVVQFHTTPQSYAEAIAQSGKYLNDHLNIINPDLTCTGAHIAPINPTALAKDEPNLAQTCCANGKKIYWFDQDVVPAPLMPLHMYFVDLLKSINQDIPIYNAHGEGKYRPHITSGRYVSKDLASFSAKPFPLTNISGKTYALVAGKSTPSGMLYQSKIEYIFKDGKWVDYKQYTKSKQ